MIDCSCEPHCLEHDADHFFLSTPTGHVRDYFFLARKPLPLQGIPRGQWLHPCGLEWPWWIHRRHRRTGRTGRTRPGPWRGCGEQAHRSTRWRVGWLVDGCFYFLFSGFPGLIATCVSHTLFLPSFPSSGSFYFSDCSKNKFRHLSPCLIICNSTIFHVIHEHVL